MKRVLHIVGKDLRRLRWWVLLWAVLLAAPVVIGVAFIGPSSALLLSLAQSKHLLALRWLQGAVAFFLVLLLVQEDTLIEERAFWRTRPISSARLLAAKLGSATVLLFLLPVAVALPWWMWCGLSVEQVRLAAGEIAFFALLIGTFAALVGAFTETIGRAILWTSVLGMAALVMATLTQEAIADTPDDGKLILWLSRFLFGGALLLGEAALIVACQFFVKHRGWWMAVAAGVMVGSWAFALRSPWRWLQRAPATHETGASRTISVQYRNASLAGESAASWIGEAREPMREIETRFVAARVAPGLVLAGIEADQRWEWPGGLRIERHGPLQPIFPQIGSPPGLRLAPEHDLENQHGTAVPPAEDQPSDPSPGRSDPAEYEFTAQARLRPSIAARLAAEPPAYSAQVWLRVMRPTSETPLPLEAGAWHAREGRGARLQAIWRSAAHDQVAVRLVHTLASPWWRDWRPWRTAFPNAPELIQRSRRFYLVNPARGEYLEPKQRSTQEEWGSIYGVRIGASLLNFAAPAVRGDGKLVAVGTWLDGASFVTVRWREEAVFRRDVSVPKLELAK